MCESNVIGFVHVSSSENLAISKDCTSFVRIFAVAVRVLYFVEGECGVYSSMYSGVVIRIGRESIVLADFS